MYDIFNAEVLSTELFLSDVRGVAPADGCRSHGLFKLG